MGGKIEAWNDRLLLLVRQYARANKDGWKPERTDEVWGLICTHLNTTPEGYRLVPVEPTPKMNASIKE